MIGEGKTRGQVSILDIPACNSQNSAAIRVSEPGFPPEYVFYYLWSQYEATRQIGSGNNQPALNKSRVQEIALPLPPLAEQRRIIAEVERRLSVVQQAEGAVEASLKQAERLRQSILKQAFSGKLVPQDPNDEPASALLERIRAEREAAEAAAKSSRKSRRTPGQESRRKRQAQLVVREANHMTTSSAVGQKLWNYCNILRDAGLSYGDYLEQLTYLIFLKMMDERSRPPYTLLPDYQPPPIPEGYGWPSLMERDGDEVGDALPPYTRNPSPPSPARSASYSARPRTGSRSQPSSRGWSGNSSTARTGCP